jgi:hypothetical protein
MLSAAATDLKPYPVVVWADLVFDENAQVSRITIPGKEELSKPFVDLLMNTLASSKFSSPVNPQQLRRMESGLKVVMVIDPTTSKARFASEQLMPRPVRREQQSMPLLRVKGDWSGEIFVSCKISASGRCYKPVIDPSTNAPDESKKILRATLGKWRFVPQRRAGKAIESEFSTWVTIEADPLPPMQAGRKIPGTNTF